MKFLKSKKYSCVFCSDFTEKGSKKVFFCRECNKIRTYIRQYGIKTLMNKIEVNILKEPSAPPYNI